MFDNPFDFFAFVIAIVALDRRAQGDEPDRGVARRGWTRWRRRRPTARPVPPPLHADARSSRRRAPASPGIAPRAAADRSRRRHPSRLPQRRSGARSRRRRRRPPPPPLPQPDRGFEETIGTRWVVWIGGLTLALGGFFMVRYSIEAGLLGPGVRTMLGGLFALALLAAGEWTRRKESISDHRGAADRQYPGDPHRRRHRGGVCNGLRGLCAVRLPGARHRLHPARAGGAGHARRGAAARAGARRPRRRRRLRHPDPGLLRQAGLLGALCLSRDRHRGGLRSGARAAVALACGHHDRVRAVVDVPLPAMRTVDGRPACVPRDRRLHPRRLARGVRLHVRPAGRTKARSSRSRPARSRPICSAPR